MKHIITSVAALCVAVTLSASPRNSFAIVVDRDSYEKCKESIDAYCQAVHEDGLDAFVAPNLWTSPEMVKDSLKYWHEARQMEGAVLVGDIPIAMVRRAQFLTTAFKMNESSGEWRENSVPSDRFYDDFDLQFDFIRRDSVETAFFYYNLSEKGSQHIDCDIYTARIKPSTRWEDKYTELDRYFRKLVQIKRGESSNALDRVSSFTGEGSFSNSMIAWVDETRTLGEQIPGIYNHADGARFYVFHQQPLMKDMLLQAACEDDSDFFVFHCHGTPDRQWIGGYLTADDFADPTFEPETYEQMYTASTIASSDYIKYAAREQYRRLRRYGRSHSEALTQIYDRYGLDSTWIASVNTLEVEKADSALETRCSILLEDVQRYDTDSRVVLFDACYNGDFREDDNIATRYIMGKGKTVVALGNSVNVLQDKVAEPLLGMLSAGYSVGQWQQQVNILESHIIGDPTFRFASSYDFPLPNLESKDCSYWKSILNSPYPYDIQALALSKLVVLDDPDAIKLIHKTFCESESYVLRLQAMLLSLHFDSPLAVDVLVRSLEDPYEFIRRKAAHFLALRGDSAQIQALVDCYFRDYNARRVEFNISQAPGFFEGESFANCFKESFEKQGFIYDRERFQSKCDKWISSAYRMKGYMMEPIQRTDMPLKKKMSIANSLRNFPYPYLASELCDIVSSSEQEMAFRIQCAEILGWYIHAYNRADIIKMMEASLAGIDDPQLISEVVKSIKRLKAYTR